ncbi:hypothetical protein BSPCLSOX_191 [uncultured Gammaproteobacteria bacterium]|nr:hypothetical protein BSPCLSOX_191 [uncultured Gammaproteobacteria bacterium]
MIFNGLLPVGLSVFHAIATFPFLQYCRQCYIFLTMELKNPYFCLILFIIVVVPHNLSFL